MSLSANREALARIHGRYSRAGRPHKTRILDEFCATCGYHRKAALRLLNRPWRTTPSKRSGPKLTYEPAEVLPVLKAIWLASDQLCRKLLAAALPEWLEHHQQRTEPLPEAFRKQLLKISPAQIDRLLRSSRVAHPKKGISATRPGTLLRHEGPTRGGPPDTSRPGSVEADTVAHCDDSTEGDYVNSLTFTELYSGWTENRAVWNKSAESVLVQLKELEQVVPYAMKDFHTDNGGEFLNWTPAA
jgi:hypothetical protein